MKKITEEEFKTLWPMKLIGMLVNGKKFYKALPPEASAIDPKYHWDSSMLGAVSGTIHNIRASRGKK